MRRISLAEVMVWASLSARAARVLAATTSRDGVRATIADDGCGGAVLGRSSGLAGLVDRVEALGGRFALDSPAGRGTTILIELPLDAQTIDESPAL
jgi:signal transduction histidine kinase